MRRYRLISLIGLVVALALSSTAMSAELEADLERVRAQIAEARAETEQFGGMVGTLALLRLQVLELTEAMLEQKMLADREGIPAEFILKLAEPDDERLAQIATDLEAVSQPREQRHLRGFREVE